MGCSRSLAHAGTCFMKLILRWGSSSVGWGGMLTFAGTCFMKLMLRWGWKRSLAYLTMCVLLTSCN